MDGQTLQSVWRVFTKQFNLDQSATQRFAQYLEALLQWNARMNLTAARDERELVQLHCADSLMIVRCVDMRAIKHIVDVGSGAGFPGIPLSIMYPEKKMYLLEVNNKKITFLKHCIALLGLKNTEVVTLDWRTFLRKTQESVDLFCARASLDVDELTRMFKPSCFYRQAQLCYWASETWQIPKKSAQYVRKDWHYRLGNRTRRLIICNIQEKANEGLI